ncbi:glutamyl-tRNA reductase, partial [Vibrio parahaemolyticus]|nr:glutamyl-tRNA reductase [Vibrio parahaemolyticus]
RQAVPASAEAERAAAEHIIATGVRHFAVDLERRRMAPAVVALRDVISDLVTAELERLPEEGSVPVDEVAASLRRLAASMAHIP